MLSRFKPATVLCITWNWFAEYSEPRIGSYKSHLLPGPSKGAISNKSTNSCAQDADETIIRRELGQCNEYEKEFGVSSKHNKGGDEEDRLREEVDDLHLITRHCDSKEFNLEVIQLVAFVCARSLQLLSEEERN